MSDSENSSGLANSFTDLMTSLAVIFILLLCTFVNNAFEEGQSTRQTILDKLQKELQEFVMKGITIKSDPNDPLALLILVPEGLLEFEFDKADIPEKGIDFLQTFVPKFALVIYSKFKNDIGSVIVEGHTDSTGSDQHNLKLSQDRSMTVVNQSLSILESELYSAEHKDDIRDYFLRALSASGRGEQDLMMVNEEEDHAQSRRVVFKIRVRSFEEKSVKKFLATIGN